MEIAGEQRGIAGLSLGALRGSPARRRRERFFRSVFFSAALLSVLISVAIVFSLLGGSIDFLTKVKLPTLLAEGWFPQRDLFSVATLVVGTLLVSFIAILVAAPLGLGAAMYLSEFASRKSRRRLKPILETLASVPSVVMAFFALRFISPQIVQTLNPSAGIFNLAAAGIAVGLLVTPLVASVAEDAMHAVPASLREAAVGLGARQRITTMKVVVPAAVSGIVAALILGVSRAIGETMIVAIVGGGTGGALFTTNVFKQGQTMTAAMIAQATGSDASRVGPAYPSLFFVGMLLFVFTFGLNIISDRFVRRVRKDL